MTTTTIPRQTASRSRLTRHRVAVGHPRKEWRDDIRVVDLMTVPHVTDPDAPLLEIVYRMLGLGQQEIVVVSGHRPVGVLTRTDLAVLAEPGDVSSSRRIAGDLLPSRTPRLLPNQGLAVAARTMTVEEAEALPVVDYRGALVGVLTQRDIVAHVGETSNRLTDHHPVAAIANAEPSSAPPPPVGPERDDDIYGPDSFPASDPPSTWAGRDAVVR